MAFHFQYLATRSGKALLLFFDNKRYLFGCFEGLQRYSIEANFKLNSLDAIFLFSKLDIPGFLGLFLTISDMGKKHIDLVGVPELTQIIKSADLFLNRRDISYKLYSECYNDSFIYASAIKINGTLNFIVKLPAIKGKFLIEKIKKYNIPPRLYSLLTNRKTVVWDGIKYNGNDFMEDDIIPGMVSILNCESQFDILEQEIRKILKINNLDISDKTHIILCFNKKCKEHFSKYCSNIYMLEECDTVEYVSFYNIQSELNKLNKNYLMPANLPSLEMKNKYLKPKDKLCYEKKGYLVKRNENVYPQIGYKPDYESTGKPKVIFLGTGAAIPNKYRNVSAIIYETKELLALLDCGEDTLGQIKRIYGNKTNQMLSKLKVIFITHSHADHHLGVAGILKSLNHTIAVIGPRNLIDYLKYFHNTEYFVTVGKKCSFQIAPDLLLTACRVRHCNDSYGVRIDHKNISIAYSGDSRPSLEFATLSQGTDLMIHECTFTDDLKDKAIISNHSTISEAIEIFTVSNSKKLILTHFSQRYSKCIELHKDIILAFDFFSYEIGSEVNMKNINEYFSKLVSKKYAL
ncbi:Ribonuclease Z, mitochondrial [Astathelohania contejeani]|uniref:ribonuclease Z n=1 Tax=Astathelohania contejeani TaxID=164912 RepID=A0ABQ7HWJ8_9MICR|nr:Ribonuclease Z, mitochondrial [Thelohania contejeani]